MLLILIVLFIKYDLIIFIPFALGVYFLFDKSWWNLLVLAGYFLIFFLLASDANFLFFSTIILLLIVVLTNYFSKSKPDASEEMDFSKLFGDTG